MPERLRYHPAAFTSFLALVCRATSADTARMVEALVRARGCGSPRCVDVADIAEAMGAGDREAVRGRVEEASQAFRGAFGVSLLGPDPSNAIEPNAFGWQPDSAGGGAVLWLAAAFVDVLDSPTSLVAATTAPEPDEATASWIAIATACPASGRGHLLERRGFEAWECCHVY